MKKLLLALFAIVILGLLGLPGLLGTLAQSEIEAQLELTSESSVMSVSIAKYDRGWFSSKVRYEIGFTDEYLEMIEAAVADKDGDNANSLDDSLLQLLSPFELVSDISHGPVGLLDGPFFGLYRSLTTESVNNPRLNEFLVEAKMPYLVRGKSTISFLGKTTFGFELPASQAGGQSTEGLSVAESLASKLNFSGATGEGDYSILGSAGGHIKFTAHLDELSLKDDESEFSMNSLMMSADSKLISKMAGIGPARMSIGSLMIKDRSNSNPVNMAMQDMVVATDVNYGSSEETLNMKMTYHIGEITMAEQFITDVELTIAIDELSALGLEQYNKLMQDFALVQANDIEEQKELLSQLMPVIHEFIGKSPTISFDPIKLTASGEQLLANLSINLNGDNLPALDNFDMLNPALWMQMLNGKAGITLSENMAALLATASAQSQIQAALGDQQEIPPEQVSQMAAAQAPILIQTLVQQGMLQSTDGQISAAVNYKNGKLLLNGQPVPLDAILGR